MIKIPEITVEEVKVRKNQYVLVDVRESHELTGPEGQIEGIILATLGPTFEQFLTSADKAQEYVFICRSGMRSGKACEIALNQGFLRAYNMKGGMLAWQETER